MVDSTGRAAITRRSRAAGGDLGAVRVLIGDLLRAGQLVRSIPIRLGRSPSTISREIRRNSSEAGN
jgi:hypothetical protein